MKLLSAVALDGNGVAVEKASGLDRHINQTATVYCWGTFDGATVALQVSPDGVEWFDTGIDFTEKGMIDAVFRAKLMRGVVSGAQGSTEVYLLVL